MKLCSEQTKLPVLNSGLIWSHMLPINAAPDSTSLCTVSTLTILIRFMQGNVMKCLLLILCLLPALLSASPLEKESNTISVKDTLSRCVAIYLTFVLFFTYVVSNINLFSILLCIPQGRPLNVHVNQDISTLFALLIIRQQRLLECQECLVH